MTTDKCYWTAIGPIEYRSMCGQKWITYEGMPQGKCRCGKQICMMTTTDHSTHTRS